MPRSFLTPGKRAALCRTLKTWNIAAQLVVDHSQSCGISCLCECVPFLYLGCCSCLFHKTAPWPVLRRKFERPPNRGYSALAVITTYDHHPAVSSSRFQMWKGFLHVNPPTQLAKKDTWQNHFWPSSNKLAFSLNAACRVSIWTASDSFLFRWWFHPGFCLWWSGVAGLSLNGSSER